MLHKFSMIVSFRHKGLTELFIKGVSAHIAASLQTRCLLRLDAVDQAKAPEDMNLPGFNFHGLNGKPKRYTVHVSGPWCITFEFVDGDALRIDLVQYH